MPTLGEFLVSVARHSALEDARARFERGEPGAAHELELAARQKLDAYQRSRGEDPAGDDLRQAVAELERGRRERPASETDDPQLIATIRALLAVTERQEAAAQGRDRRDGWRGWLAVAIAGIAAVASVANLLVNAI